MWGEGEVADLMYGFTGWLACQVFLTVYIPIILEGEGGEEGLGADGWEQNIL